MRGKSIMDGGIKVVPPPSYIKALKSRLRHYKSQRDFHERSAFHKVYGSAGHVRLLLAGKSSGIKRLTKLGELMHFPEKVMEELKKAPMARKRRYRKKTTREAVPRVRPSVNGTPKAVRKVLALRGDVPDSKVLDLLEEIVK